MPKIKTNRAAAKRFRKTASGKYKCGHANKSHILTKKATKRKRNLRQTPVAPHNVRPGSPGVVRVTQDPSGDPFRINDLQPARAGRKAWSLQSQPTAQASHRFRKDTPMPKIKTNRAAAKRFRKTASGKYKCGHANKSHILTKKATKRKRNLRQTNHVRAEDAGRLDRMLPYL